MCYRAVVFSITMVVQGICTTKNTSFVEAAADAFSDVKD